MRPCINPVGLAVLVLLTPLSKAADAPVQYTGPGSCSSTSCHGGVQPRTQTTVLQNEYSTWTVQDKHARAFSALTGDFFALRDLPRARYHPGAKSQHLRPE